MNRGKIWAAIAAERERQGTKWGPPHQWGQGDCSSALVADPVKVAVLTEECGEVARCVLDGRDGHDLQAELIQVAAVAVAWLEGLPEDDC